MKALAAAGIAAEVLAIAGVMYAVTTFLFAFSGGQYRMVEVVGLGALLVTASALAVALALWRLRSPGQAATGVLVFSAIAWTVAVVGEWLLSFSLGAT